MFVGGAKWLIEAWAPIALLGANIGTGYFEHWKEGHQLVDEQQPCHCLWYTGCIPTKTSLIGWIGVVGSATNQQWLQQVS